jgi:hypothetical protein
MRRNEPVIKTLNDFKALLKERTETYLHARLRWATVEEWIDKILQKHIEDIVMQALGYESDYGGNKWKLRYHSHGETLGVQDVIKSMARKQAEEVLPALIEAKREEIDAQITGPTYAKHVVDAYNTTLNSAIHDKMKDWVEKNATLVVAELFDRHAEDFAKQTKLQCPLTMDSLLLIAKGTDGPDNG